MPGPSAVLTALALSGLPVDRFCFEGFLPRKAGERLARLREVADERRTLVYFEAPHRIDDTLAAMAEVFGADRRAAVCRELTKTYEEVRRGPLAELAAWAAEGVRGEITVVVEGAPEHGRRGPRRRPSWCGRVAVREEAGERRKEAIAAVAGEAGLPKRRGLRRGGGGEERRVRSSASGGVTPACCARRTRCRERAPHRQGMSVLKA